MPSTRFPLAAVVAATLVFAACGADDDTKVKAENSSTTAGNQVEASLECPGPEGETLPADADVFTEVDTRGKPTVAVPKKPATELCTIDDIVGIGDPVPEGSTVTAHYVLVGQKSRLEIDSSWERSEPFTTALDQVIQGWTKGIPGMRAGGRRTLVVPGDLAYGATPPTEEIAADETLVFVVDLISFQAPPEPPKPCEGSEPGPNSAGGEDVAAEIEARGKPTVVVPDAPATALCYIDEIVGAGAEVPAGASVTVHYVGVGQQTKQQFDASWDNGQPASFSLSGVIPGWTQGIPGMKVGGRRTLIIPGELAYGESPPSAEILANETLVFTIDLISIDAPSA